jgi:hypothetical protein
MANNMRAITTVTTAMKARSRVPSLVPPIERALNMYTVWEHYTKQLRMSKPNHGSGAHCARLKDDGW